MTNNNILKQGGNAASALTLSHEKQDRHRFERADTKRDRGLLGIGRKRTRKGEKGRIWKRESRPLMSISEHTLNGNANEEHIKQ